MKREIKRERARCLRKMNGKPKLELQPLEKIMNID